ncbi:MAG: hypothetical protein JRJ04_12460 [Deltaproteobacteria bacterium]|nr:hypothetical protein [Deltaproteobacteria bacterium]MBW1992948.1 hypothetical protein [Deltaproteobacteria bacterium]
MKYRIRRFTPLTFSVAFVMICILASQLNGCSTYLSARRATKKVTRDLVTFDDDLVKSVGIVRFENWSYYRRDNIEKIFQNKLTETLGSACSHLLLARPEDENYPDFLVELPPRIADRIDNLNLALLGRQYGFDAIATGAIVSISAFKEKRGLFWLRDTHSFIQIQIMVKVFDTETGAKLVDENFIHELEVDETDYEFVRAKKPTTIVEIPEALKYIASIMGEKICDAISAQPWKSYVISKQGKRIIISCGSRSGIRQNMVFKVYNASRLIKGVEEQQFFLPGPETGEIRITYAHPDFAEAIVIADHGIQVGDAVKAK